MPRNPADALSLRPRSLAVALATVLFLGGCAGSSPPTQTIVNGEETYLPPLPSAADATEAPLETDVPSGLETPAPASIGCTVEPPVIVPGATYQLFVVEAGNWYGTNRYYEILGLPEEQFITMQDSAGGDEKRVLLTRTAQADVGRQYSVSVVMRDYDVHGTRPYVPGQTIRPAGTDHLGQCGAILTILTTP